MYLLSSSSVLYVSVIINTYIFLNISVLSLFHFITQKNVEIYVQIFLYLFISVYY